MNVKSGIKEYKGCWESKRGSDPDGGGWEWHALTALLTNSYFFLSFCQNQGMQVSQTLVFHFTMWQWPPFSYLNLRDWCRRTLKVSSNCNVLLSLPSLYGWQYVATASSITSTYPFSTYLLSNYYMPGTVLGAGNTVDYETLCCLPLQECPGLEHLFGLMEPSSSLFGQIDMFRI